MMEEIEEWISVDAGPSPRQKKECDNCQNVVNNLLCGNAMIKIINITKNLETIFSLNLF